MAGEEVTVSLRGQSAHLGSVQARDVARLLLDLESALAASAYVALGKPRRGSTGRHVAAVEAATRLHLRGIREGSVVAVLGLPLLAPDDPETFDVGVDDLAGAAFDQLVAAFNAAEQDVDPALARALADMADAAGVGDRSSALAISSTRANAGDGEVVLDAGHRIRFRRIANSALTEVEPQPDMLFGTLREADLDRRTARLHTPNGEVVSVTYPPELEEQVHDAMRGLSNFGGVVTYDPKTSQAKRVDVRRISPPAMPLFGDDFWSTSLSIERLAAEQRVGVPVLDGPQIELIDDERADLLAALVDVEG